MFKDKCNYYIKLSPRQHSITCWSHLMHIIWKPLPEALNSIWNSDFLGLESCNMKLYTQHLIEMLSYFILIPIYCYEFGVSCQMKYPNHMKSAVYITILLPAWYHRLPLYKMKGHCLNDADNMNHGSHQIWATNFQAFLLAMIKHFKGKSKIKVQPH